MPDLSGASMNLEPSCYDYVTNDDPEAWCAATLEWSSGMDKGSPGDANELCTSWDYDGDGYVDGELTLGTLPDNSDTDSDGMADGWEHGYGLDPLIIGNFIHGSIPFLD